MNNNEIANRLREIAAELEQLSGECMFNNHEKHERANALLQGNIDTSAILLRRTAFYLP